MVCSGFLIAASACFKGSFCTNRASKMEGTISFIVYTARIDSTVCWKSDLCGRSCHERSFPQSRKSLGVAITRTDFGQVAL